LGTSAKESATEMSGFEGKKEGFDRAAVVMDQAFEAHLEGEESFKNFKYTEDFRSELQNKYGAEQGELLFSTWRENHDVDITIGRNTHKVSETGSFEDGFYGGIVKGQATCQDPAQNTFHNVAIVGTVELPWVKQVVIKNDAGDIIFRRRLFLVDGEDGRPILLMQPEYHSTDMADADSIGAEVTRSIREKYEAMGVEVRDIDDAHTTDAGINTGYSTFSSGRSPFYYIDGNARAIMFGNRMLARNGLYYREAGEVHSYSAGWSGVRQKLQ
jgi:hypothetical protein